ncbi:Amidohydrolase [Pirellulimonas nuda]|uniref:Amidohydrolase n=1 Tax=Pirellulimonas nuda TaxID=2528009 RepID=A0A518DEA5_9BACT|nr:amidohydrolase family protein [Pirellulimonas nuda]QDU89811.1 Amidohydrolase [Pirellulimonas nuda]
MILDSHHHLWQYSPREYGWIGKGMESIARDFALSDLEAAAAAAGVEASVAVQARQTVEETDWLISLAEQPGMIRGVVGWAPLADPSLARRLERWADHAVLKGLRHVVQDEPDDGFLDREDFNRGVRQALAAGYSYDILIFARHLPAAIRLVDRHPEGRFVLDHLGKPAIAEGEIEVWRTGLNHLAERPNVCCKVSGMVTEADWEQWSPEQLRPYLDAALEAFGPGRLMFGSDWPVSLLASPYHRWVEVVSEWAAALSQPERDGLFYRNAADFYRIDCGA